MSIISIKAPEKTGTQVCADFFGNLFSIRDQVHLMHLSTKSYAHHIALNDYYEEILDLTDELIESYQGKYGILNIQVKQSKASEPISVLKELVSLTDGGSIYNYMKESWIKNQLDEISSVTYRTIYKLENLK